MRGQAWTELAPLLFLVGCADVWGFQDLAMHPSWLQNAVRVLFGPGNPDAASPPPRPADCRGALATPAGIYFECCPCGS
jgi:hypothetical protein